MQRLELPGGTGPLEEPLEQVLPGLPSRELQAGSHLQEANHQPPLCLLRLFALQHTPHGTSLGWRERLAASSIHGTGGTGTHPLVVSLTSTRVGAPISSSPGHPEVSAVPWLLPGPGGYLSSRSSRVTCVEKQSLFPGDLRALPQGDKAVRCGDLGEMGQGQSCPSKTVRDSLHAGSKLSVGAEWDGARHTVRVHQHQPRAAAQRCPRQRPHTPALLQDVQRGDGKPWDAVGGHHVLEDAPVALVLE